MGLIINTVLNYKTNNKFLLTRIQFISVKMYMLAVIILYICSRVGKEEQSRALDRINTRCGSKAIFMGDMNARCSPWDRRNNPRGLRLKHWFQEHGWHIRPADKPCSVSLSGSSMLDKFVTKDVPLTNPITGQNAKTK